MDEKTDREINGSAFFLTKNGKLSVRGDLHISSHSVVFFFVFANPSLENTSIKFQTSNLCRNPDIHYRVIHS